MSEDRNNQSLKYKLLKIQHNKIMQTHTNITGIIKNER